jgi:hypothetical protein
VILITSPLSSRWYISFQQVVREQCAADFPITWLSTGYVVAMRKTPSVIEWRLQANALVERE